MIQGQVHTQYQTQQEDIDATGTVIDDGVSTINVDGPVGAGIGVELGQLEDASFETGYSADVNFNVVDDANDIAALYQEILLVCHDYMQYRCCWWHSHSG